MNIPTPVQLEQAHDAVTQKQVEDAVPKIIEYLTTHYIGQTVSYSGVVLNPKATKEIIRLFGESGWTVVPKSDQRDGNWLEFSKRGTFPGGTH